MQLALGPGLGVFVCRSDIQDRAWVLGDRPHEAVCQPGGAADLSGLHKSELPDAGIREPKMELPEVGSVVGIVATRTRREAFVERDIFLSPIQSGRPAARVPDASELLGKVGINERWHLRGGSLWRHASHRRSQSGSSMPGHRRVGEGASKSGLADSRRQRPRLLSIGG